MWLVTAGMMLIFAGMLLPLLGVDIKTMRWIFAAGALINVAGRLFSPYKGDSLRVRRLHRIESWSGIFFCVGAFFLFYPGAGPSDWLAFTLAGGAIVIYTSIMIPRVAASEARKKQK